MTTIAIDLGGTNVRAARIEGEHILAQQAIRCNAQGSEDEVLGQITSLIDSLWDDSVGRIGIGVPSVVDFRRGIVYNLQNIPSWREVHLKERLEHRYGVAVGVDNDVNCFVLGEHRFGSARGMNNVVGITLGTGLGAGIVVEGEVYRGANTGAGEIGCLPYLDADYEQYCSSHFFSRSHTDGSALAARAAAGDAEALAVWNEFGHHLGKLLQVILFAYDPETIVVGGGIAASGALFEQAMLQTMREGFPYPHVFDHLKVCFAQLDNANLLGASQL